ncbi:MAG: hypothetical protein LC723_14130 [Actinobacteria bacterium]|nr:hypothetical protein [Actinomycetota bacterium]
MGLLDHRQRHLVGFGFEVSGLAFRVRAASEIKEEARASALRHFEMIESYVVGHPGFKTSFVPVTVKPQSPPIVRAMAEAAEAAGVGPMVGLPGALVEAIARDLSSLSKEVIVACEGDAFIIGDRVANFVVEPPRESSSGIGVRLHVQGTSAFYSSGGRSKIAPYIGNARGVAVVAKHGAMAGCIGSAMGYAMHRPQDVERALDVARTSDGVVGALVLAEDRIGVWGEIELVGAERGE